MGQMNTGGCSAAEWVSYVFPLVFDFHKEFEGVFRYQLCRVGSDGGRCGPIEM